jgi:hypothetical protein
MSDIETLLEDVRALNYASTNKSEHKLYLSLIKSLEMYLAPSVDRSAKTSRGTCDFLERNGIKPTGDQLTDIAIVKTLIPKRLKEG